MPVSSISARNALAGFYLSGLLTAFLGAILPAWGYHLRSDYALVGYYFLSLNAGMLASVPLSQWLLSTRSIRFILLLACGLAAGAFFFLAAVGPPRHFTIRLAGVAVCGLSAGLLNASVFTLISPAFRRDPAATINLSGLFFGLGSLTTALVVSGAYYVYTTGAILIFLGIIPAFLAGHFARAKIVMDKMPEQPPLRRAYEDFKSPSAVLFALLLFFQFGNEWAIAGWLPLFLTQRLGVSPESALHMLVLYWFALIVGRFVIEAILPKVSHGKLLMGSVVSAMFGCLMLTLTNNTSGASVGLLLIGGGFASIYPLVVEKIGGRFPNYHPGLYNGLFSFAVTGGLLAAASLGFWAQLFGIGIVMTVPLIGSIAVFILLLIIWLETKLMGH